MTGVKQRKLNNPKTRDQNRTRSSAYFTVQITCSLVLNPANS